MEEFNARKILQEYISFWVKKILELENNLTGLARNSKEFQTVARFQAEYKGRVYAARSFANVLGYEFDTDYTSVI